ncbi:MAG TPA: 30S ribosomal protein S12 methylthiotransferase RimO [Candidatus Kryptonia bacterium]|nr:30S ribosomal protein S12 methylthiotransferase RimO [Candidatus Kryptonia bacterium]
MAHRVYLQSLGCPKNLVDSEQMLGLVARGGAEIVLNPEDADVLVVNTCGFIGEAKKESIEAILELAELKQGAPRKRLIVTGCLVQRYGAELQQSLPEVDGFLGTGDFTRLPELLDGADTADASGYGGAAHVLPNLDVPRARSGHFFSAYLKVSEGCDHRCSFCIIPKIRGRHESKPIDRVVAEAETLVDDGVVELNLIAQDLTAYGKDRRDGSSLSSLLRRLCRIDGLRWIRLLYTYPRYVSDELLDTIAGEPQVCGYIDMPLQHVSDAMLSRMRRERSGAAVRRLIDRMRQRVPGLALRTAFIVGFPGETEADFAELMAFVSEARLDHVGVFRYSREEGTEAGAMSGQIPAAVKQQRYQRLMTAQSRVAAELNRLQVGSVQPVLVCGQDPRARWYGRTPKQAPDIDGVVYLAAPAEPGTIVPVAISDATIYDLEGTAQTAVETPVDTAMDSL